jgi:hypothetical protein
MKHSLCFLAGALLVTCAVIWAGGSAVGMFLAGGFVASVILAVSAQAIGFARAGRFFSALDRALESSRYESPRVATPGRHENDNTPRNGKVVSFKNREMLRPIQQDVLSALVNLGMPMMGAERLVIEASKGRPGLDFDTLFRLCLPSPARLAVNA